MLDIDLLKNILIVAMASSIITTAFVQKVKETFQFKKSNYLVIVSFIFSMLLGTFFALSFSNVTLLNSLWVGLISFIGADVIYKTFEDKIFKTYKDLYPDTETITISKDNEIK